ncbi:hypothetical protein SCUP515_01592 [Seiridium cupressi]
MIFALITVLAIALQSIADFSAATLSATSLAPEISTCAQFLANTNSIDSYPDARGLRNSADTGCDFCGLIVTLLQSDETLSCFKKFGIDRDSRFNFRLELSYEWHKSHVRREENMDRMQMYLQMAVVCATPPVNCPWPSRLQLPRSLGTSLLEDGSIAFVKDELRRCVDECAPSSIVAGGFLPTRLLNVTGRKPKLVETSTLSNGQDIDTRYIALSYCWGNGTQPKLTKSSKASMSSEIPLARLAPVQADIITLAKVLAVPFVWIDALCILQDDRDDWCRESSNMHRIYASSYLTVCVLSTASCQQSFLARTSGTVTVPFLSESNVGGYFQLQPFLWLEKGSRIMTYSGIPPGSPWSRRAWTFQEQAMATRLLYVTKAGFTFSCSSRTVCEQSNLASDPRKDIILANILISETPETLYRTWADRVIPHYSARELTYNQDRLPALPGVAQIFAQRMTGDKYAAGLWAKDLHRGLMWILPYIPQVSLEELLRSFSDETFYVSPTWSWTSRPSTVITYDEEIAVYNDQWKHHQHFQLIDLSIVPQGSDSFGQISKATMYIRAQVHTLPATSLGNRATHDPRYVLYKFGGEDDPVCIMWLDWQSQREDYMLDGLSLVLISSGSYAYNPESLLYGLVVHPARGENTFVRVGTFWPPPAYEHVKAPTIQFFFEVSMVRELSII